MTVQWVAVAIIVPLCTLYAVWNLMGAAGRRRVIAWLARLPWLAAWVAPARAGRHSRVGLRLRWLRQARGRGRRTAHAVDRACASPQALNRRRAARGVCRSEPACSASMRGATRRPTIGGIDRPGIHRTVPCPPNCC